jgi:acyl-homoserine-lactone acylase
MGREQAHATGDGASAADIRFTTHGVAHIRSDTWRGVGFGQGWAIAGDHLPTIADQIVKVRSERARFHGAGPADMHVASDLGYRVLGVVDRAEWLRDQQPAWIAEMVSGYVAGYNRRLGELRSTGDLPAWCADAEWIRPIDELDLYAYIGDVALMGSGRNLAHLIGWAQAPGPDGPFPAASLDALGGPEPGSNGWAIGGDVTASGGGMVLANPHFPWGGEARFWECHLTLPGQLDVYGVSLLGAPGVQMGFNDRVAWTHTFSKGHRFTIFQLGLAEGDPTSYRFGDEVRPMASSEHRVQVLGDDGQLSTVERTMWRTHHGPMLNMPLLGWGSEVGFSYRDANDDNARVLEQFMGMAMADDLASFRRVFHEVKGLPWVNTLAVDRSGDAWYTDASATPALSDAATARFLRRLDEDLIAALAFENRIAMLDGSEPDDDWVVHDGARSPGLEPPERLPELTVRDLVVNANDSHWLSHPQRTLEGYPVLCGLERTPRSLRTRQNLRLAQSLAARGSVTLDDLADAVFDNASLSAELLRGAVVARCRAAGTIEFNGSQVDLGAAADVLERWDGTTSLDSVGAVLWRELMCGFDDAAWKSAGALFEVAFDPDDPIATPHTLAPAPGGDVADPLLTAVAGAIDALTHAGVALDAPLGDVQRAIRGEHRVPVHGGGEAEGMLNVLAPTGALASHSLEPGPPSEPVLPGRVRTGLAAGGYQVTYGTSFLAVIEMTPDGPEGRGLLAYGQSGDPMSPHHVDGTRAYAAGELRPLCFREDQIEADPELRRVELREDDS